nr:unnamed protein product [Ipomoea batatas]
MNPKPFSLFFILFFIATLLVSPITCARELSTKDQVDPLLIADVGHKPISYGALSPPAICNKLRYRSCLEPPKKKCPNPYSRNCSP